MQIDTKQAQVFSHEIKVGNKLLKARKWKAKDRKIFKKLLQEDTENVDKVITNSLVYSCLETPDIPLTSEEVQYIFIQLRKISISDEFHFSFTCDCKHNNNVVLKLDDICTPVFSEYKPIKTENIVIELQDIKNKKFYDDNKDEYDDIKEMAFRVKSINKDETKTFNDVVEYLEELDIQEFDELYEQFLEMSFNVDNEYTCTCEKCKKKTKYEFDEIPNFFPESWTS